MKIRIENIRKSLLKEKNLKVTKVQEKEIKN